MAELELNTNKCGTTPNPTKEEIDALERELQKIRRRRIRKAINPIYG